MPKDKVHQRIMDNGVGTEIWKRSQIISKSSQENIRAKVFCDSLKCYVLQQKRLSLGVKKEQP